MHQFYYHIQMQFFINRFNSFLKFINSLFFCVYHKLGLVPTEKPVQTAAMATGSSCCIIKAMNANSM